MEKLVDRHIRDETFGLHPLHQLKFAYHSGKYTEAALHYVIALTEEAVENKEVIFWGLLDIEGAFDSTSHYITIEAVRRHGFEDTICRWISCYVWQQENKSNTGRKNLGGVCGQGVSAGRRFIAPALQPACGWTQEGLSENGCYKRSVQTISLC